MIDFDALVLAPCARVFGEAIPVWYYPASGPALALTADAAPIFSDKATRVKFDEGAEVIERRPLLTLRASTLPGGPPVAGELFRIRGVLYAVVDPEPDGMGEIKAWLRYATDAEATRAPRQA